VTRATRIVSLVAQALASLRLAVFLMVSLGLSCIVATFYEAAHGTPATQRAFYGTWWFASLLVLLGVNIFASMMKRYPWRAHHAGFVIAHVGILVLLCGSLVSLRFGLDSNMALYEGETSDRLALLGQAVEVSLPEQGVQGSFDVDFERRPPRPGREQRFPIPGSGDALVVEEYLPHARTTEDLVEDRDGAPALSVHLASAFANQDVWLWAGSHDSSQVSLGPVTLELEAPDGHVHSHVGAEAAHRIVFKVGADGRLSYTLATSQGKTSRGVVKEGRPIETPWMGMTVTVNQLLGHATTRRSVVAEQAPAREERRVSAVKVRVEGPKGSSAPEWLVWSETRTVAFAGGTARIAYRSPERAVPFRVTLVKFNSEKYPGSNRAATYESAVRIEDAETGTTEHRISMNQPLHYRGYIFFQASYVEGQPMMSILSVTRAPGLPLVYLGVGLISLGVLWMFYLKPYLARAQGARALAARAQTGRESPAPSLG
jgi:hypothetical protein